MIQKPNQIVGSDRRILSFPAVFPGERVSPRTLLDSLAVLSQRICNFSSESFASQRKNCREVIRQIRILQMFFEELVDRGVVLPRSIVVSFSELHLAFQKILFLLEDCSREGAKLWVLMKSRFMVSQSQVLVRAIATALDVLPLSSIDVCEEVKELIELVGKQARKERIRIDPSDEQATNRVISLLNLFEKGVEPDPEFIRPVLDYLEITTWTECDSEIKFLENEIDIEFSECGGREVQILSSLLGFMLYNRAVLFKTGEKQVKGDLTRVEINGDTLNFFNPEDFRCPISLEIMIDPVIVSTGQSYDRSSIQKWLKSGNLQCPVTGERLTNTELIPNTALKKLTNQFFTDNGVSLSKLNSKRREVVRSVVPRSVVAGEAMKLVSRFLARSLVFGLLDEKNKAAFEIRLLAKSDTFARFCLIEAGTILPLLNLLSSNDKSTQENTISALLKLSKHANGKKEIVEIGGVNPILAVLKHGLSTEAKQTAAAIIFYLSSVKSYRRMIRESPGAVQSLVELVENGSTCGKKNAVVAIFALILSPENKERFIEAGLVPILTQIISSLEKSDVPADSLAVLAELSETFEGTFAILNTSPLPTVTRILCSSSASKTAKEYCVSLLFCLCRNGGDLVVMDLAKDRSLTASLYSLVSEGTSRAGKRACSLINMLQDFQERCVLPRFSHV
ncbi:PREDICTED: U-box domain-containing protein 19-like [Tarenaya hassleriana]|uniref:U-box domain-containing protein 19-like n=1 Tax=Tarenaya hassleriana TaxID=28532 RepID=UPI00053C2ED8|nr:PREDICTED: U-box domain-containing protein 19-like [Tarenaya hassleriana]